MKIINVHTHAVQGSSGAHAGLQMQEDGHDHGAQQTEDSLIKVNGWPLGMIEPHTMQHKLQGPVLLPGKKGFAWVDVQIRVKGSGHMAQV